jgi:hypothetical protein
MMAGRSNRWNPFRAGVLLAALSLLAATPSLAVVISVPAGCDSGDHSLPCSCAGFVCTPNASIRQLKLDTAGYTFDCSVGGYAIGGTSTSDREADPIVEISASSTRLRNCTVQHGNGRGVSAHDTVDVTLLGNTISDTQTEAVSVFQVGSSSGASGTGVVLERNVISKARRVASGPGDNAVGLYSLTAGSSLVCNVLSSQSNGVTNNGNSTLHSQCNAFLQYGTKYVTTNFSPIAENSEQGSGMHSEYDCVVTVGDDTNPLIPTRCRADAAWNSACSALLSGTCLNPLSAFGSFSLPIGTFDHDEDGDGVVDWRDANHDGLADTDTFGIGSVGRNGDVTNTTIDHALIVGVQRALWASAVQPPPHESHRQLPRQQGHQHRELEPDGGRGFGHERRRSHGPKQHDRRDQLRHRHRQSRADRISDRDRRQSHHERFIVACSIVLRVDPAPTHELHAERIESRS